MCLSTRYALPSCEDLTACVSWHVHRKVCVQACISVLCMIVCLARCVCVCYVSVHVHACCKLLFAIASMDTFLLQHPQLYLAQLWLPQQWGNWMGRGMKMFWLKKKQQMHKSLYSDTRIHDWVLSFPRALLLCPLFLSLRSLPAVWVYGENKSSMEDKDIERFHCRKTSVQRGIKFVSCSALCLTVGSWARWLCVIVGW